MYASLVLILKAVGILSGFLLLGTILRAKVPVFQNLYLPASVIGGFIALILGPRLLGWLPFSDEIMDTIGSMPSVLITPVFAAIPMCLYLKKNGNSILKTSNDAIVMTMILGGFFMFQCVLGIIAAVFSVERRLTIDASCQTEEHILLHSGLVVDAGTGAYHPLGFIVAGFVDLCTHTCENFYVIASAGVEIQFPLEEGGSAESL